MEQNPETNSATNPPQALAQQQASEPKINPDKVCKICHSAIFESYYFCPHCGHKIKEPPYHFSLTSTISILLISFLFPPFGIIPGFKYLRNKSMKAKFIGVLAIAVTMVSFALFLLLVREYINMINRTMNSINSASYY